MTDTARLLTALRAVESALTTVRDLLPITSASGTVIPPAADIWDTHGHRWTLDPKARLCRDGVVFNTGISQQVAWFEGDLYLQGDGPGQWYRLTGDTWVPISVPLRDDFDALAWEPMRWEALDLAGYRETFNERFTDARGAIAPGDSHAVSPFYAGAQGGPYGLANVGTAVHQDVYLQDHIGGLIIRAQRTPDADPGTVGGWFSGHIQTVNSYGGGFAQQYGYFEARMKFPDSHMAWPAFWLKHQSKWTNPDAVNVELDIVEWYGKRDRNSLHHVLHLGPGPNLQRRWHEEHVIISADLTADWHAYGALLDPDWVTIYVDREAVARHRMIEALRQPLYPQVTLSIDGRAENLPHVNEALSPMDLQVDRVTVWAKA
jgi:hypothetical protein